ncbi:thioredoxin-like [Heterodontus francisci]|uniref:thioredoxin-like n=1 Tax=Heterodontus francisci TaxID=7792 RepID=UPI00355BC7E0
MGVQEIKSYEEFQMKLKEAGDKLVVIDYFADWCGPCKMIAPKFTEFSDTFTDVIFYKVNVDEADDVAQKCQITSMPTFHFYKNGVKVRSMSGSDAKQLKKIIEELK